MTPTAIKELFIKADKLPPEALKELLKHIGDIPPAALEELIKNIDQLSPDVIATLLASKDLPPALREKLLKEINSNKKLKDKLKSKEKTTTSKEKPNCFRLALDPLAQGVQGVGKVVPKAKPEVKKPKIVSRETFVRSEINYFFFFRIYQRFQTNPKRNSKIFTNVCSAKKFVESNQN